MKKEEAKSKAKRVYEEIQGGVNEVISSIRELIKEGSARKLIIKNKEGEVVFQTQLAFGVGGAALVGAMAPVISAIGMFAMFINDYQILVEKEVDPEDDDYSVDAEVIEITEDEDEEEEENTEEAKAEETEEKEEKTVGKKKKK
ncbi:MAG: DUF4342 domain-containing protein [Balneola sp.]|jgi:hypothetical protein|nr:hypothetical protein [Balneola sp.]MAO78628.1 hypothetical protein [Balneola sp.]MBF63143.1 hypothetical protein [Balneola sp.]MBO6622935.1 DUF4342 domain-containing protein [Balneola sp.]MBO6651051.1 DUF4342 domain-containing protein [Balneola sp.]|tara:strand:- start:28444 stop:28875 length:432 start_codon:yes stop_codon:yes gene_type:complete